MMSAPRTTRRSLEFPPVRPRTYTARELMGIDFPEPKVVVPGLLLEGLDLLVAREKSGKSWLMLGTALAVATGGRALGNIPVQRGSVLYLALEDGVSRCKRRLAELLHGQPAPDNLVIADDWPKVGEGCEAAIEAELDERPDTRLVVIDTFKKVRPPAVRNGRLYDADYEALDPLAKLARRRWIAVAVVHHSRKMESEDALDNSSGTTGLTAVPDAILVMRRTRGQADASLYVTGRDIEDHTVSLRWDAALPGWAAVSGLDAYRGSQQRADVLRYLTDAGHAKPGAIAQALSRSPGSIRALLLTMRQAGEVRMLADGFYVATNNANDANALTPGVRGVRGVRTVSAVRDVSDLDDEIEFE